MVLLLMLVLVHSSGPSGYGSYCLLAQELGDLWDVPIHLLDSLTDAEVTGLIKGIFVIPLPLNSCTQELIYC